MSVRSMSVIRVWGAGAAVLATAACATLPEEDAARASALADRVATLTAETQTLEDVAAVKRLQRAYGYYIDKGFWDEAADLFAADATFETGVDGVYVGQDSIRALIVAQGGGNPGPGLPFGQYNHRMQLQPVVTIGALRGRLGVARRGERGGRLAVGRRSRPARQMRAIR